MYTFLLVPLMSIFVIFSKFMIDSHKEWLIIEAHIKGRDSDVFNTRIKIFIWNILFVSSWIGLAWSIYFAANNPVF